MRFKNLKLYFVSIFAFSLFIVFSYILWFEIYIINQLRNKVEYSKIKTNYINKIEINDCKVIFKFSRGYIEYKAEQISAHFKPVVLFRKKVTFSNVVIHNAQFGIEKKVLKKKFFPIDKDHHLFSFIRSPVSFQINQLTFTNSNLFFDEQRFLFNIELNNIDLSMKYQSRDGNYKGRLTIDSGFIKPGDSSKRSEINDICFNEANLLFSFNDSYLMFPLLQFQCFAGNFKGQSSIHWNDKRKENNFMLTFNEVKVDSLLNNIYGGKADLTGYLSGNIEFRSLGFDKRNMKASANIDLSHAWFSNKEIPDCNVNVNLENQKFNLNCQQNQSHFNIQGHFEDKHSVKGNFKGQINSVGLFLNLMNIKDVHGMLVCSGRIEGNLEKPELSSSFELFNARYSSFEVKKAFGNITFRDNKLHFEDVQFSGKTDDFKPLSEKYALLQLDGVLTYNGSIRGDFDSPELEMSLSWKRGKIFSLMFDSLLADILVENDRCKLNNMRFYRNDMPCNLQGDFTLQKPYILKSTFRFEKGKVNSIHVQGSVVSEEFNFNILGTDIELEYLQKFLYNNNILSGIMNFKLMVSGELDRPEVTLSCSIDKLKSNALFFDKCEVNSYYKNQCLEFKDSYLKIGNERCHFSGQLPLSFSVVPFRYTYDQAGVDVIVSGSNLPLIFLNYNKEQYAVKNSKFDINMRLSGDVTNPWIDGSVEVKFGPLYTLTPGWMILDGKSILRVAGTVRNPEMFFNWNCHGMRWKNFKADYFSGKMNYADSLLVFEDVTISSNENISNLKGQIPYQISFVPFVLEPLDLPLTFESHADQLKLAIFNPILNSMEALSGELNYDVIIGGTFKEPIVVGGVNIDNVNLKLQNFSPLVSNLSAIFDFNEEQAKLMYLSAQVGSGEILMTGNAEYKVPGKLAHVNINVDINDIDFSFNDWLDVIVDSAALQLNAGKDDAELTGFFNFENVKFKQVLRSDYFSKIVHKSSAVLKNLSEYSKNIFTNLTFSANENLWVDNNYSLVQMDADLNMFGMLDNPSFAGQVHLLKGSFYYLNRKFKIINGIIDFSDPYTINPRIYVEAKTVVKSYENITEKSYTIIFTLNGDLSDYVIALSSEPNLSPSDIIAILTVGKKRQEISITYSDSTQESLTGILMDRAQTFSSKSVAHLAEKQIGTLLSLDDFVIKGDLFDLNSKRKTKVIASKNLLKDINFTYSTVVGYANKQRFKIGYKLSDRISIESETDQEGRAGIDIKFKYKFK